MYKVCGINPQSDLADTSAPRQTFMDSAVALRIPILVYGV